MQTFVYHSIILWLGTCCSFTQVSSQAPCSHLFRENFGRVRAGKVMGWYKNSLIRKAKNSYTSKAKQGIILLLHMGKQEIIHTFHVWSLHVVVTWEDKHD